jgi:3-oxoadipate enol-lactonase
LPFALINNARLFYRLEGRSSLPVLVLSHSLGCDHSMWAPQMPDLLDHFQVLRYDTRGHGASDVPAGNYTLDQLGQDVMALTDRLGIANFAFCGISMGGAVGQWLANKVPQRLTRIVLANTGPKFGTPDSWDARRKAVLEGGMQAIVDMVIQRFFSPEKQADTWAQSTRAVVMGTDPKGYAACCMAMRDADFRAVISKITMPVLVIGSDKDPSTPWEGHGAVLAREIPGARAVRLETAHLSNLERPEEFTAVVLDFLLATGVGADRIEAEVNVRKQVLEDERTS